MLLTKKQLEKYAQVMVWALCAARRNGKVKPYETVLLRSDIGALPLAREIYNLLLDKHLQPVLRFNLPEEFAKDFYTKADKKQLTFITPGEKEFQGGINGLIALRAPQDLTHLKTVDPARIAQTAVAHKPLREILDVREQKGLFSWTLCNYPTDELAKRAGLTPKEYANQVARACFLNEKDPVKKWQEVTRQINEIGAWLTSLPIETLHVESAH
ncbi:MAG: aminopeptidase, partial [Elusimicrobiaceae bacterium]|nr:aminopeptidase [Elusimicrobiaceae bacterium]